MYKKLILLGLTTAFLAGCGKVADSELNTISLDTNATPEPEVTQGSPTVQPVFLTPAPTPDQNPEAKKMQSPSYTMQTTPVVGEDKTTMTPVPVAATEQMLAVKEVILKTSKGDMTIELYPQETPKTVQNFLEKMVSKYYEGLTFHRVESWVVQGGDPLGTGTGGGKMPTELSQRQFKLGSVGVARGGDINVSNDSQFFICTDDCSWLTGQYTNFGTVTKGMDVAKKMAIGDKILSISPVSAK